MTENTKKAALSGAARDFFMKAMKALFELLKAAIQSPWFYEFLKDFFDSRF